MPGITPASAGSTRFPGRRRATPPDHPRVRGEHLPFTFVPRNGGGITPASAGSTSSTPPAYSTRADHPRVRGEHRDEPQLQLRDAGSPPRPRGAPARHCEPARRVRITPASAGSTNGRSEWGGQPPDHPRVRGEHQRVTASLPGAYGSPPRPRGARMGGANGAVSRRITPASAGSTSASLRACPARTDHPRVRGEHEWAERMGRSAAGSPPRPRGAPALPTESSWRMGITPASAGSTIGRTGSPSTREDHPRVRGEHNAANANSVLKQGSPPRPRGAHLPGLASAAPGGITPASAGSTLRRRAYEPGPPDHPRVRGEHSSAVRCAARRSGSPPRPRGAPPSRRARRRSRRITPASAGSTGTASITRSSRADHPRVRGEHCAHLLALASREGSPPRPRGALLRDLRLQRLHRITPASAGSTDRAKSASQGATDHPRVRGEHCGLGVQARVVLGSPPRPRGAPYRPCGLGRRTRDHPLVRGEHTREGGAGVKPPGSPPRPRGAHAGEEWESALGGITPASAGSTVRIVRVVPSPPDHPRVRGEHRSLTPPAQHLYGSPPRPRGAPRRASRHDRHRRITPASAGSTRLSPMRPG